MVWLRSVLFSSAFIATFFVVVPRWILVATGRLAMTDGALRVVAFAILAAGGAVGLWCVGSFSAYGKGTPAPFDPPRRLVIRGPYRYVRNPMYIAGILILLGEVVLFASVPLLQYTAGFWLAVHLLVIGYEEHALARTFGEDYTAYRASVRRWLPRITSGGISTGVANAAS